MTYITLIGGPLDGQVWDSPYYPLNHITIPLGQTYCDYYRVPGSQFSNTYVDEPDKYEIVYSQSVHALSSESLSPADIRRHSWQYVMTDFMHHHPDKRTIVREEREDLETDEVTLFVEAIRLKETK